MKKLTRVIYSLLAINICIANAVESFGQIGDQNTYSFSFDHLTLIKALDEIQSQTDYSIFYKKQWLDSISVSGDFQNMGIEKLLDTLFSTSAINYTIFSKSIILTGDIKLTSRLNYTDNSSQDQSKYVFEREFKGDTEQIVTTIGNRSLIKVGKNAIVAGFVKNTNNDEPIERAIVYDQLTEMSTLTDARGFYSLNLSTGEHLLMVRYSGMKTEKKKVILFSDGALNIQMEDEPKLLDEIVIKSDLNAGVDNLRMGATSLNMESLKNVPKILGENDIVQVALTLPGVQSVGEGAAGINVRGGKTDQNLILFNNATIYNAFHFFGFFSTFNADVTGNSELLKSGIPASYGGRLSSLLNIQMKKANKEHFAGTLGISPVTSKVALEIPIFKGKTSLMLGGRTTYSDWVINQVPNKSIKNSSPSFLDFSANLNHSYRNNNSINVSTYFSKDKYKLSTDSINSYSNFNTSLEWNHLITDHLTSTLIAGVSNYQFNVDYNVDPVSAISYGFGINERFGKVVLSYFVPKKHEIQGGFEVKIYDLQPGQLTSLGESVVIASGVEKEKGFERAVFISDEYYLSSKISFYAGLRYSFFSPYGKRTINYYEPNAPKNDGTFVSSEDFEDGKKISTYHGPEIRLSGKYSLTPNSSIKIGISQMRQYIYSISNTVSVSPIDTWKLADPNFAPQRSWQYSMGYYRTVLNDMLDFSAEAYYKTLGNLLDYKIGANLVLNKNLEREAIQGVGKAYGIELLLKKPVGKLNGWLSYSYSRSLQKFDSEFAENRINGGNYFPSNFDKPHNLSLVTNYKYTRRFSFSMNVIYNTGRPVTYSTGKYHLGGVEITQFSDRNSYRIPDYFRVDISVNIEGSHRIEKLGHGYWSLSIYNVLARKNVYSVFFTNTNGEIKGYNLSILGTAIPSITYNLKF